MLNQTTIRLPKGLPSGPLVLNGELRFRALLEKLPAGAYTCDPDGLITYFNQHATQIWGRSPKLNDPIDRFCGSFKLYAMDGSPITHDQCWMALALKNNLEYNGHEIVIEHPDGKRLTALAHASPIHNETGQLLGAVNVDYVRDYPVITWTDDSTEQVKKTLLHKFEAWRYEGERRIIRPNGAHKFLPFDLAALVGVIFGLRATDVTVALVRTILADRAARGLSPVRLYRAQKHGSQYALVIKRLS